jgi:mycothiol S-conjugate amidase
MSERLSLLSVHAHPDDEASKGAATVHRYHEQGVHTVLVCCTGGEAGDILNPAMDTPEVRARLHEVRMEELDRSASIIGFDEVIMLGYKDSGMPDTPANEDPDCFARADLDEAVGRLVKVIREHKPQVMLTYADDQQGYPHPDHLRVHEISMLAIPAAADPDRYPDLGAPWQIQKTYYSAWSRARVEAMHRKYLELGLESPYDKKWFERPSNDERHTTHIDVSGLYDVRAGALKAHATQIDPLSPFWFGLPDEVAAEVYPQDDFILAQSEVPTELPEDDLFAGISVTV